MSLAKIVASLTLMPTGITATIRQLAYGTGPKQEKNNMQANHSIQNPDNPIIQIDEETIRYLLSHYYQRPTSFVVFSSDARQRAPGLYERIEDLRNGYKNRNKLILQLVGDRFSAMAECKLDRVGHELRITSVAEQRSGSIYSGINTPPSS